MTLELPNHILTDSKYQLQDLQIDVALVLYQRQKISLARAARWIGMNRLEFQKLLKDRSIPINLSIDDFKTDLKTLESML